MLAELKQSFLYTLIIVANHGERITSTFIILLPRVKNFVVRGENSTIHFIGQVNTQLIAAYKFARSIREGRGTQCLHTLKNKFTFVQ